MSPDRTAKIESLCRSYLAAMEKADLDGVLANFTGDATATSPLSGKQPAREFYAYVMRVTSGHAIRLKTIYVGASDPSRAAVHFDYTRKVGDGAPTTIDVVDVFQLTEDLSKFSTVTIIYDTAPVRPDFAALGGHEDA